jgi:pancreatic triacylglycerol lipase
VTCNFSIFLLNESTGFGLIQPIGHVDFYPNGGTAQPGCNPTSITPTNMTTDSLVYLVDCNHMRAILLFIDSLTQSCQSVAYECDSYATFKQVTFIHSFTESKLIELNFQGKCASCGTSSCAPMGISADKYPKRSRTNVKMYLDTAPTSPYCESFHKGSSAIVGNISATSRVPSHSGLHALIHSIYQSSDSF